MKRLWSGSALGEAPYYCSRDGSGHAPSIRELLAQRHDDGRAIDLVGLRSYLEGRPDGERTCFQNASVLPAGSDLYEDGAVLRVCPRELPETNGALLNLLEQVVSELLDRARKPVIALSGGLDSALVLALVRRVVGDRVPVVTLATSFPGYCELEETMRTAETLHAGGIDIIEVGADDFVAALPEAIRYCETPLFNLHPISKFLLARAVAQRGYDAVVTGDGADQVFAGADARNYLPIVGALVRGTGVALASPFFDERVIGWAKRVGLDPEKSALRRAASAVVPDEVAWRRKTPRFAPDFDLAAFREARLESQLAPRLGLPPPTPAPGRQATLWATTALLLRRLGGTF